MKVVHEESSITSYFFSPFTVFAVCIALLTVGSVQYQWKILVRSATTLHRHEMCACFLINIL